jgi:D-beta-D-heptose 7-phosphate kinase/D-beta-D-heptose 1-phosphate adenosyltransferase
MLDRYLYGNAERLSPEAPVPVLHFQREEIRLGGAGGVAANLAALGAKVRAIGVLGEDAAAQDVRKQLDAAGVDCEGLVCCTGRPTICKVRLVGLAQHRHPQQMMRLDFEEQTAHPPDTEAKVRQYVDAATAAGAGLVCIEDYNKGLLTPGLCQDIIRLARERGLPVLIDPANIPDYSKYAGATCLKLNRTETQKATGLPANNEAEWAAGGGAVAVATIA